MPCLEDSHLSYITNNRLAKGINNRYATYEKILRTHLPTGCSVLELFGGIGVCTGLLLEIVKPSRITVMDIADDCLEELKRKYGARTDVTILKQDAFAYDGYQNEDWIILDSFVSLGKMDLFVPLFDKIGKTKSSVVMTDTSTARLRYLKKDKWLEGATDFAEQYRAILLEHAGLQLRHGYYSAAGCSFFIFDRDLSDKVYKMEPFSTEQSIYTKFLPPADGLSMEF